MAIAYNILGLILDRQGKTNEAITAWTKALQLDPTFALAHSNIGVILTKQRQVNLATIKYRQAIRFAPNFYFAHYNLGVIFFKQGKKAQAQVKFQQALYFNSNLKIAKQGLWLAHLQQNKKVKTVLVGVLSVSLSVLIWLLLVIISPYNATVARFVLSFNPNDANLNANLGVALHQKGKLEKARVHYQEAISLNPKLIYVYNNLGIILEKGG